MFHRILIPIDGTEQGAQALQPAVAIARRTGAQLIALYVKPDVATPEEATAQTTTEARIRHAIDEIRASGIRITIVIGEGKVQDGVLAAIWDQHPSLVILAPHSRHGPETVRHPSVTHFVITHAHVPLLIWPGAIDPQMHDEWLTHASSLIIVPLDGGKLAEQAIVPAEAFAREFGRTLLLFRAIPPRIMPGIGLHVAKFERQAIAADEHAALHYLSEARQNLAPMVGTRVETLIVAGDPSAAILDFTNAHPGSLIVMSTHGRNGFARFILGSVTFEVLGRTHTPLLIVPPEQYAFAPAPEAANEQESVQAPAVEFGEA